VPSAGAHSLSWAVIHPGGPGRGASSSPVGAVVRIPEIGPSTGALELQPDAAEYARELATLR